MRKELSVTEKLGNRIKILHYACRPRKIINTQKVALMPA
jgi:hypothetical protein